MAREPRKFLIQDQMSEVYTGSGGRQSLTMPAGLELFKPKKTGYFRIEVIPFQLTQAVARFAPGLRFARPGTWHWTVIYRVHGGVGPDNGTVVCPFHTFNKSCPICEERARLGRSAHPDDKKLAKKLFARERQLLLVAVREEGTGELGPVQLWEVSTFNFKTQLDVFLGAADPEDRDAYAKFWHPEVGLTMKVIAAEQSAGEEVGVYTKYGPMELRLRREPLPDHVFDHGHDLYALVRERSYADIKAIFSGVEEEGDPEGEGAGGGPSGDSDLPTPKGGRDRTYQEQFGAPTGDYEARKPRQVPLTVRDEDEGGTIPVTAGRPKKAPEPPPEVFDLTFKVGSLVSFTRVDPATKEVTDAHGEVVGVDDERQVCQVKIAGRDRPLTLDFEELALSKTQNRGKPAPREEDDPPPAKKQAAKMKLAPPPDDDEDMPPPPKSHRAGTK